jgi:hypothetical protein
MGRVYSQDAFRVLQILRQWTSGGTAGTFIDNNKNVQEAWTQLIWNYESHDARNTNIQKARETIAQAHWSRDTQNFTFNNYCNPHIKANNELDCYGANVDRELQVNAFLKGIQSNARLNPQILAVKTIVLNGDTTKNNLRNAIIAFKDTMRQLIGASNKRDTRYIGTFTRGGHGSRGCSTGINPIRGGGGFAVGRDRAGCHQGHGHGEQQDAKNYYMECTTQARIFHPFLFIWL